MTSESEALTTKFPVCKKSIGFLMNTLKMDWKSYHHFGIKFIESKMDKDFTVGSYYCLLGSD